MDKNKLLEILDRRLAEHNFEIKGSELFIDDLKNKIKNSKPDFEQLNKLAVLKDRILWNKAIISVLDDLKKEVNESLPDKIP